MTDTHIWLARRSHSESSRSRGFNSTSDDSEFQRDRARIIHSASFRSLQSKTQVLGLGESDFYRTRLTHSLEVAQIGSGIAEWLRHGPAEKICPNSSTDPGSWIPSFNQIEAVSLAHDLGHSPFGHGGEVALNFAMKDQGGFEANGQTLRILARLGEYSQNCGLDLTRRSMLGVIKYPIFYSEANNYQETANCNADNSGSEQTGVLKQKPDQQRNPSSRSTKSTPLNLEAWHPPKCIYDEERDIVDWILKPFTADDQRLFRSITSNENRHHRSVFKCFDTSIMELADDIAYGIHDLEDAATLGLLTRDQWMEHAIPQLECIDDHPLTADMSFYTDSLFSNSNRQRKHAVSKLVGYLIGQISITEQQEFEHPLLRFQASMHPTALAVLKALKQFVMQWLIKRPELQALQFKGQRVIVELFDIFLHNPATLLPTDVYQQFKQDDERAFRVIADYLSAMSDVSAGRLHNRLTQASHGSIFDRL